MHAIPGRCGRVACRTHTCCPRAAVPLCVQAADLACAHLGLPSSRDWLLDNAAGGTASRGCWQAMGNVKPARLPELNRGVLSGAGAVHRAGATRGGGAPVRKLVAIRIDICGGSGGEEVRMAPNTVGAGGGMQGRLVGKFQT